MSDVEQIEQTGGNIQTPVLSKHYANTKYVMTWHNYPEDAFEQIELKLCPLCKLYVFGEEYGKSGKTKHIQGAFILKGRKMRATAIQNLFGVKFYLAGMKGTFEQQNYCVKEGNFILTNHNFKPPKRTKLFLSDEQLNAWELKIVNLCDNVVPNDRDIYWFWSRAGNLGKTTFAKYLHNKYDACVIGGKSADSKNCIASYIENSTDKRAPEIVICPIPRSYGKEFISYEAIEMIKDMFFYSGKYEGGQVNDNPPHLFVFGNHTPEWSKMSGDRWKVFEIIDDKGNYEETPKGFDFESDSDDEY